MNLKPSFHCQIVKSFYFPVILLLFFLVNVSAQDTLKKFTFTGYVSDLQSASFDSINKQWEIGNLIHNRLNLKYYPAKHLSLALELRNRLSMDENTVGNTVTASNFATDNGFFQFSHNLVKGNSYVLNSTIDRIWLGYEIGKFHATLGRQRINWSQTMVWNPNDIFNAYSFFDFDYVERPGSDALRLQYYQSEVSSSELAVKMNKAKQVTAAFLYKFNVFEYDFQVLCGTLNQTDYVAGIGWSGAIKRVSFRGEVSYFHPQKFFADTTGIFLASVSLDYTFSNSLSFLVEYLYDGMKFGNNFSFQSFYNTPLTVKNLSFTTHNLLVQTSYPFTPLFTGSIAAILLPGIRGCYIGPNLTYSLSQNIDGSIYVQTFRGRENGMILNQNIVYLRLKYSF